MLNLSEMEFNWLSSNVHIFGWGSLSAELEYCDAKRHKMKEFCCKQ